jgi:uncharacterized ion transporter superfamily protein YfcC
MDDLNKKTFIQTTIETHKNETLENTLKEAQQQSERFKSLTNNDNYFVKALSWIYALTILLFFIPMMITSFLTKGFENWKEDQKMLYISIGCILLLIFAKNNVI